MKQLLNDVSSLSYIASYIELCNKLFKIIVRTFLDNIIVRMQTDRDTVDIYVSTSDRMGIWILLSSTNKDTIV